MTTATRALPSVPEDVLKLAAREGAAEYLRPVLEMTRQVIPTAPLAVALDTDPEIPGLRGIRIDADLTGVDDADVLFDLHRRWADSLFQVCPATHVTLFGLRIL